MKKYATFLLFILIICFLPQGRDSFRKNFTGETLRVDYYAVGTRTEESAQLISMSRTGEWAGPRKNLIDPYDLGDYRVILRDKASGDTLYLCGFSTLFGEWRTTAEALTKEEKYYSSRSVPMPRREATVILEMRDKKTMKFVRAGSFDVDPSSVKDCALPSNDVVELSVKGGCDEKVDLSFIAEGYRAEEREKFLSDALRFADALFACPPFDGRQEDFNVRAVMVPSDSSGTDFPGLGIYRSTALNSNFYTFGTSRYLTTADMKSVSDAVWDTPTDAIIILVNNPVYGGGGIYNFYAIGTSDNARTLDVFVHEFGHSFGALADEYFDAETAYEDDAFYNLSQEPWEPNITTKVLSPCKWKEVTDSLYEGGGYLSKGIWRPSDHCMMRDYAPFCPVCTRSILRNIDYLCDRDFSQNNTAVALKAE